VAKIRRITASEEIYQHLRQDILSLKLIPGQELDLDALAADLEVSRSPLRDALLRLSDNNLVDIYPQRGTRVALIDLKHVEEERFFRKSLEHSALSRFITRFGDDEIAQMNRAIDEQSRATEKSDWVHFLEADDAFHAVIFNSIELGRIWELIVAQGGNYRRIRLLSFFKESIPAEIVAQHKAMITAITERNLTRLLELENLHLSKLLAETEFMLEHYPTYFK